MLKHNLGQHSQALYHIKRESSRRIFMGHSSNSHQFYSFTVLHSGIRFPWQLVFINTWNACTLFSVLLISSESRLWIITGRNTCDSDSSQTHLVSNERNHWTHVKNGHFENFLCNLPIATRLRSVNTFSYPSHYGFAEFMHWWCMMCQKMASTTNLHGIVQRQSRKCNVFKSSSLQNISNHHSLYSTIWICGLGNDDTRCCLY